jgi:hypothetical protein
MAESPAPVPDAAETTAMEANPTAVETASVKTTAMSNRDGLRFCRQVVLQRGDWRLVALNFANTACACQEHRVGRADRG